MQTAARFPVVPSWLRVAIGVAPVAPSSRLLAHMARSIRGKRSGILARLEQYAGAVIVIAPSDLPVVFRIQASAADPVAVIRRRDAYAWDARVTAPFFSLLAMLHGVEDADALFFSREVVIEGDTSALLAFRNALDAEEIDLTEELLGLLRLPGAARNGLKRAIAAIGRKVGVPVTRGAVAA